MKQNIERAEARPEKTTQGARRLGMPSSPEEDEQAVLHEIQEHINLAMAVHLGASRSPLLSFEDDDDWSFIIKMQGYVELALSHLIVKRVNNPALNDFLSDLDLGHDRRGKIALAKALLILPTSGQSFVKKLNGLRNTVTHDIAKLDVDLVAEINADKNEIGNWRSALTWWLGEKVTEQAKDDAVKHPRHAIFRCTMQIMCRAFIEERNPVDREKLEKIVALLGEACSDKKEKPTKPNPNQSS